jgi:hypothetical protein
MDSMDQLHEFSVEQSHASGSVCTTEKVGTRVRRWVALRCSDDKLAETWNHLLCAGA